MGVCFWRPSFPSTLIARTFVECVQSQATYMSCNFSSSIVRT
uniref:Uncharacterized protein n=1 Tax=Arundo donax TaxID=35708 RepID=A0A0A9F9T0_ARUDO